MEDHVYRTSNMGCEFQLMQLGITLPDPVRQPDAAPGRGGMTMVRLLVEPLGGAEPLGGSKKATLTRRSAARSYLGPVLAPRRVGTCRYLPIPIPSSQPVCSTTACWGGVTLNVVINVPPTARIR